MTEPEEVDPEEILARQRAAIDQATASMPEIARLNFAMYSEHVKAGFEPAQALVITQQMLQQMMEQWF